MMFARDLTEEEKLFCQILGAVVIAWNHVEMSFRTLLHYAARGEAGPSIGERIDVLLAHMGNFSMAEAMQAIAEDFDPPASEHLIHCAALFDALRLYRNYYVHAAITFATTTDESHTVAIMQQMTAKGGALKLHQGTVKRPEVEAFQERLFTLQSYVGSVLTGLIGLPNATPLASLEKPPLPDKLELRRLRLIELKRQRLS